MPIYEFVCPECGKTVEKMVLTLDDPVLKDLRCSLCGSRVERVLSVTGFILKGRGWAKDGYSGEKK